VLRSSSESIFECVELVSRVCFALPRGDCQKLLSLILSRFQPEVVLDLWIRYRKLSTLSFRAGGVCGSWPLLQYRAMKQSKKRSGDF
jgi:hypothetical protein